MKVLIQISIAGHVDDRNDFYFLPGQEADVDTHLAEAWLASGVASPIEEVALSAPLFAESEPASAVAVKAHKPRTGKKPGK